MITNIDFLQEIFATDMLRAFRPAFCHGRKHSQTIFTIEILIKILAASPCMIGFFCKSMVASNFCDDRKSALRSLLKHRCKHILRWLRDYMETRLKSLAFFHRGDRGDRGPLRQFASPSETFALPLEMWSENNRNVSIRKEICITIDFAP